MIVPITISLVADFSPTPSGRYRADGPFSGEAFREDVLRPAYERARLDHRVLHVDLSGAAGLPASFLEEAFGGLARAVGAGAVETALKVECHEDPEVSDEVLMFIRDAARRS